MKKYVAALLVAVILISNSTAFAAEETNSPLTISLDAMETILLRYSPDLSETKNNLDKLQSEYEDLSDEINDLQDTLNALPLFTDSAWTAAVNISSQLTTLRENKDAMAYSVASAKILYNQQIGLTVLAAKQQYLLYLSLQAQQKILQNNLSLQNEQLSINKMKYDWGFLSKKQYDSYTRQVSDLKESLDNAISQTDKQLKVLRTTLGIPETADILVTPAGKYDFDMISSVNYEADLALMLENCIAIKTKEIDLNRTENAADPNVYDIDNAKLSLSQAIVDAKSGFESKYETLIDSYDSLQVSYADLTDKMSDLTTMERKLQFGFVSALQLNNLQNEVSNQKLQVSVEENNLYSLYIAYDQTKNGY